MLSLSKHCPFFLRRRIEAGQPFDRLRASGVFCLTAFLAACAQAAPSRDPAGFPLPDRPVSTIVSAAWSSEPVRERKGEAEAVIAAAGITPGMAVADIGAGEGYYTLALAAKVGPKGRVIAEDIMPATARALAARVRQARLPQVEIVLGTADDAKLPSASVDRILLIHMYHEITSPYALMAHLRAALKPGGRIVIVDADRRTDAHGTPPKLLACELAAVGFQRVDQRPMPQADGYLAMFEAKGAPPAPAAIKACPNAR